MGNGRGVSRTKRAKNRKEASRFAKKSNNIGGRGGKRPGVGRKKKAVVEKAKNGNPGGRSLSVLDIPEIEGAEMSEPHDFLSTTQKDGTEFQAKEIYTETWEWLKEVGVSQKVPTPLIERYTMCAARWIQCEELTSKFHKSNQTDVYGYNLWDM